MSLLLTPFDYQEKAVDFMELNPYCIAAMKMGTGKTLLPILYKDRHPEERILVICPSSLIYNWRKEILKFYKDPVITVFKSGKDFYPPVDSDFVICSYDLSVKFPYIFDWATFLILDEAQALKDMNTKRTQLIHKNAYEASISKLCMMTGTPIKNRVKEFYSLISLCNYNPRIAKSEFLERFPDDVSFADYFSFRKEFDMEVGNKIVRVVKWFGLQREDELKKWLKGIYFSMASKMPKINYKDLVLADFKDNELLEEFLASAGDIEGVKSTAKQKSAVAKVPLTIKYLESIIESGDLEGPAIVYTDHRESCHLLANHFNTNAITGEMSVIQRQKMADQFQEGRTPVLVATFGAFSEGYTLTRSNFIIMNDYPWSPGSIEQAEYRINRTGQARPCHVHRIFGSEQDEYIFNAILEKKKVLEKLF